MSELYAAQALFDVTVSALERIGVNAENAHFAAQAAMRSVYPEYTASRGEGQVYHTPVQECDRFICSDCSKVHWA